jgi:hypothetical protein
LAIKGEGITPLIFSRLRNTIPYFVQLESLLIPATIREGQAACLVVSECSIQ